jgi:hypothetical protein
MRVSREYFSTLFYYFSVYETHQRVFKEYLKRNFICKHIMIEEYLTSRIFTLNNFFSLYLLFIFQTQMII